MLSSLKGKPTENTVAGLAAFVTLANLASNAILHRGLSQAGALALIPVLGAAPHAVTAFVDYWRTLTARKAITAASDAAAVQVAHDAEVTAGVEAVLAKLGIATPLPVTANDPSAPSTLSHVTVLPVAPTAPANPPTDVIPPPDFPTPHV